MKGKTSKREQVYRAVTRVILEALEGGTLPWRKPWGGLDAAVNGSSGEAYTGFNQFVLTHVRIARALRSRIWLTWKQISDFGGRVLQDRRKAYVNVLYFKRHVVEHGETDRTEPPKSVPIVRYYKVWNLDDTEAVKLPPRGQPLLLTPKPPTQPIAACERVLAGYSDPPRIEYGGVEAAYRAHDDTILMPRLDSFRTSEDFYGTLFHEIGHSTGVPGRLNRPGFSALPAYGVKVYSHEELVAEMAAAYLCGVAGISNETIGQSASYIAGWLTFLQDQPNALITAASQAQKAASFVLGLPVIGSAPKSTKRKR